MSDRELAEIEPAEFGGEDQASVVTARKQRFCFFTPRDSRKVRR